MANARLNNIFGALVLSLNDEMSQSLRKELDQSREAIAAIITVGNNPGHTVDWLSKVLSLTHSGAVRLVTRLETQRLMERRQAADDARSVALFLTASGVRRMQTLGVARRRAIDRALAPLTPAEQAKLCELTERMLARLATDESGDRMCRLCDEAVCPQGKCPITLACS